MWALVVISAVFAATIEDLCLNPPDTPICQSVCELARQFENDHRRNAIIEAACIQSKTIHAQKEADYRVRIIPDRNRIALRNREIPENLDVRRLAWLDGALNFCLNEVMGLKPLYTGWCIRNCVFHAKMGGKNCTQPPRDLDSFKKCLASINSAKCQITW